MYSRKKGLCDGLLDCTHRGKKPHYRILEKIQISREQELMRK